MVLGGPFGFVSADPSLGPLLPGSYELEASFCGQTFEGEYMVEEPSSIGIRGVLVPDCAGGAMAAELGWKEVPKEQLSLGILGEMCLRALTWVDCKKGYARWN